MAKSMTKSEIIEHLANKTKTKKKVAGKFLEELVKLSYKEAKKDFVIPGLGKLKVSTKQENRAKTIYAPKEIDLDFEISQSAIEAVLPKQNQSSSNVLEEKIRKALEKEIKNSKNIHVIYYKGNWAVKKEGTVRAEKVFKNKDSAIIYVKRAASKDSKLTAIIHSPTGSVESSIND